MSSKIANSLSHFFPLAPSFFFPFSLFSQSLNFCYFYIFHLPFTSSLSIFLSLFYTFSLFFHIIIFPQRETHQNSVSVPLHDFSISLPSANKECTAMNKNTPAGAASLRALGERLIHVLYLYVRSVGPGGSGRGG